MLAHFKFTLSKTEVVFKYTNAEKNNIYIFRRKKQNGT
jgi:hypothetical protein